MSVPQAVLIGLYLCIAILLAVRLLAFRHSKKAFPGNEGACMTIGGREVQEDRFGILKTASGRMAVLSDGMGKAYGGRIASRVAVDTFTDIFRDYNAFDNPQYFFRKAFHAANREILKALDGEGRGAASLGAVLLRDGKLYYALVGNVKICVYRNGDLVPVSSGHTLDVLAQESFRAGKISRQDALALLDNHRLYNYLGQDGFHDLELFDTPIHVQSGDIVVLMSDSVSEMLDWKEIEQVLSGGGDCKSMAFEVIEKINRMMQKDKDNASIVLLRVERGAAV